MVVVVVVVVVVLVVVLGSSGGGGSGGDGGSGDGGSSGSSSGNVHSSVCHQLKSGLFCIYSIIGDILQMVYRYSLRRRLGCSVSYKTSKIVPERNT